jgi:MFS family permease
MVHRPFRWYRHLTLNAYWFGVSLMWNALHPIVLPVLVLAFAPESAKNTSYGLLTFAGLVVAALVQPISGSLSDGTQHHLGRRRPWILAGTAASLLCLTGLAVARSFWAIAGAYVLLQCCSNIAHGPAQGLMRDAVPSGHRGPAAGAKQLFDMLAVIIAATFAGRLMDDGVRDAASMMALIAGVLVVFTAVTTLTVHEPTATAHAGPIRSLREHLAALAQIDYGQHRDYLRLLAARFCVLLGTYAVQSFGLFYFRDVLQVASASRATSGLMAAVAVSIMVTALPAGSLSERWGRKRPLVIACALTGVGLAGQIGIWQRELTLCPDGRGAGPPVGGARPRCAVGRRLPRRGGDGHLFGCLFRLGHRHGSRRRGGQVPGAVESVHGWCRRRCAPSGAGHGSHERPLEPCRLWISHCVRRGGGVRWAGDRHGHTRYPCTRPPPDGTRAAPRWGRPRRLGRVSKTHPSQKRCRPSVSEGP